MRYILTGLIAICLGFLITSNKNPGKILSGYVMDEEGNAIANATVTEKNTANKVTVSSKGYFQINLKTSSRLLIVEAAGFVSVEAEGSPGTPMKITLQRSGKEVMADTVKMTAPMIVKDEEIVHYESLSNGVMRASSPKSFTTVMNKEQERTPYKNSTEERKFNTEDYDAIVENNFQSVLHNPLSTFSIDVDAASYSNIRRYLNEGQLPPEGSVRIEEMINYFHYDYPAPLGDAPFSINTEMAICPWNTRHQLMRIGLQGKKIPVDDLPASNLVFLIDVSGSMNDENKLPLVKSSMRLLVDQLREKDRVAIVVYAGSAGLVLPSTSGDQKLIIKSAIDNLEAGGSTAGGEGIKLAYSTARAHFQTGGNNRIILCTDGDFNIGASSDAALEEMISNERKSNIFLTVLGYGMGNYKDNKMQKLADKGNGNHAYIDAESEAKKVLVNEFGGTLFTIAKDVKLQVEFNPALVQSYRLIGYENRMLNKEDFNDDKKDAGELGSGHSVTALYEIIPTGVPNDFKTDVDTLIYQRPLQPVAATAPQSGKEVLTLKLRYKQPDGNSSRLLVHKHSVSAKDIHSVSADFRFVAAVAEVGMLLRHSAFAQGSSYDTALKLAASALGTDQEGYRRDFMKMIKKAQSMNLQVHAESNGEKNRVGR